MRTLLQDSCGRTAQWCARPPACISLLPPLPQILTPCYISTLLLAILISIPLPPSLLLSLPLPPSLLLSLSPSPRSLTPSSSSRRWCQLEISTR